MKKLALALIAAISTSAAVAGYNRLVSQTPLNDGKGTMICVYSDGRVIRTQFTCPSFL